MGEDRHVPKQLSRTEMILGTDAVLNLATLKVAVFGIGGVGGYVCEALARSGIGKLVIIDSDTVDVTNINRQIIATHSTVGRLKVEVMKERIMDINPECEVEVHECFFLPETANEFDFSSYDYIVDAVDTVAAKIELACKADEAGTPIISAMGAGNKLDPAAFKAADISKTSVDPLAKAVRKQLRKRGIEKLKVVYSEEKPIEHEGGRTPGSIAFVPSVMGLIMAGEVIRDLANNMN